MIIYKKLDAGNELLKARNFRIEKYSFWNDKNSQNGLNSRIEEAEDGN